jgi:hypothetical protein
MRPVEEILQDFIDSNQCLLPEHIIAAMTALFDLEDDDAELVNDALLQHVGPSIDDIMTFRKRSTQFKNEDRSSRVPASESCSPND